MLVGRNFFQRDPMERKSNRQREKLLSTDLQLARSKDRHCTSERLSEGLKRTYQMYDEVKTFVMFIGCSRNTDKLTSAMLDAHSEILLPQNYDIIGNWWMFHQNRLQELAKQKYMLFYHLHHLSSLQTLFREQATETSKFWLWTFKGSGIDYKNVPGAWQGTIKQNLKAIGDSSGLVTSTKLLARNGNFSVLRDIEKMVGIPVKFVHIITNPFDDIASIVIRTQSQRGTKVNDPTAVNDALKNVFALLDTNEQVRQIYGDRVLDVYINDLMLKQKETLKNICSFLEIHCDDFYFKVIEKVFTEGYNLRPRDLVEWKTEDKNWIETKMKKFDFLQPLSFESSY